MSRVDSPRQYSARILSSNPANRRWRLLTIFGSKLPSRSRGASISTFPCSVISVFGVVPLRWVPGATGRLQMRLIADMVGQLDLHRPLHQPLGQLRQQPARPGDLLLGARAGQQLVDHLITDPPIGRHPQSLPHPAAASRALDGLIDQLTGRGGGPRRARRAGVAQRRSPLALSSLGSSPGNPGANPNSRPSRPGSRSNVAAVLPPASRRSRHSDLFRSCLHSSSDNPVKARCTGRRVARRPTARVGGRAGLSPGSARLLLLAGEASRLSTTSPVR